MVRELVVIVINSSSNRCEGERVRYFLVFIVVRFCLKY